MKTSLKAAALMGGVALLVVAFKTLSPKQQNRDHVLHAVINQAIKQAHYSKIDFDDEFSSKVFDEYIRTLDYGKRMLLKTDLEKLETYRYRIDDQIRNDDLGFFYESVSIIKARKQMVGSIYNKIITEPIDFSIQEGIHTNVDSLQNPASEADLADYWRRHVKLAVLERVADQRREQQKALERNDTSYHSKTMEEMVEEARKGVKENYDSWLKRLNKVSDRDYLAYYLNAIIAACDPHSEYLPPDEKKNFDISMSGKFEGIGATLQSRNGQTKVVDIIPGSASWRQGELQVDDIIMKVGQGDDEPLDIANMDLDDVVKKIRGKKGSVVKLTVKKKDGSIKVIPIERDVVVIEETYAKSSVIESADGATKVGYIYLPKFYADFNDRSGRFCSKDVKKELDKIAEHNVDGVILDLRNNGGGSLADVVDMTGLFIPGGPVVQVVNRDKERRQLEDRDYSIHYGGPLVVLINGYSASASEILAAALQDYDRAIIMGSNSSFGKGTVQTIYDLDMMVRLDSIKPLGALKLTIQKFYRINGGTTQLQGVIPDIIVPDNYAYMKVGEKELHNPLACDKIAKSLYTPFKHSYSTKSVVSQANSRIKKNPVFKQVDENARRLKMRADESYFPLEIDTYENFIKEREDEGERFKKIGTEKTGVKASFLASDKREAGSDTVKVNRFTRWFGDLEKDIYIQEAINVISDMK